VMSSTGSVVETVIVSGVITETDDGAVWLCCRTQYCSPVHCVSTSTHRRVSPTVRSGGLWSMPISVILLSHSPIPSTMNVVKMAKI